MEELLNLLEPLLLAYAGKYGFVGAALAYIISARAIAKSLEKVIGAVVKLTASESDDAWWVKVQSKKWYQILMVVLDWSTTIKLPEPAPEEEK